MNWKPKGWIAILIGIVLQPFVFLYVNRPKLFWIYFTVSSVVIGIDFLLLINMDADSVFKHVNLSWIFFIICPIHAYKITKSYDENQPRNWYTRWWAIPSIYLSFFLPIFLCRVFLFEPFSIPSISMSPSINVGDHVIVKKWGFGGYSTYGIDVIDTGLSGKSLVQRGKVYVFHPPHSKSPFVKRLIGLPGDLIEIKDDAISVNGKILLSELVSNLGKKTIYREENETNSYLIQRFHERFSSITSTITIPENNYFFLGDNRDNSADSRTWGTVSGDDFVGEVVYVF